MRLRLPMCEKACSFVRYFDFAAPPLDVRKGSAFPITFRRLNLRSGEAEPRRCEKE